MANDFELKFVMLNKVILERFCKLHPLANERFDKELRTALEVCCQLRERRVLEDAQNEVV